MFGDIRSNRESPRGPGPSVEAHGAGECRLVSTLSLRPPVPFRGLSGPLGQGLWLLGITPGLTSPTPSLPHGALHHSPSSRAHIGCSAIARLRGDLGAGPQSGQPGAQAPPHLEGGALGW